MKWIALFSQTGSEIVNIAEKTGKWPDQVFRDTSVNLDNVNSKLKTYIVTDHEGIVDYLGTLDEDVIVTLHGYLRILPALPVPIYNGHPALCTRYPELKGYNPQEKTWNNIKSYPIIGSIIHEVTEEVDSGKLIKEVCVTNWVQDKDDLYKTLSRTSLWAWCHFMRDFFNVRRY